MKKTEKLKLQKSSKVFEESEKKWLTNRKKCDKLEKLSSRGTSKEILKKVLDKRNQIW